MSICSIWQSVFGGDTTPRSTPQPLSFMDAQGTVIESIRPNAIGRVRLQGVSWPARCADKLCSLPVNTPVHVTARVGLTLLIRPVPTPAAGGASISRGVRPISLLAS
ncbi:MAG: NfeD family protein [Cyanobacteria bacterium J06633_23]